MRTIREYSRDPLLEDDFFAWLDRPLKRVAVVAIVLFLANLVYHLVRG